jgi:serine/threonine protein kinase/tetratricopeptide (TPR) repeat protein
VDCPSCGRANASDHVECSYCDALLVDVFQSPAKPLEDEKTDPLLSILGASVARREEGDDSGSGFTRAPMDVQYTGDLPRLFRFGNRYQILEKLGEGGMGRVYKALDLELDRAVALKTIRAEKGTGPEVLKRFKQELVLARKITHKNVVRIYDLGESEGMKFFTMELVEGQSLRDVLRDKKTVSAKEAISLMKQMLSGLAEAHAQGIVHRDLKPQNIMLDRDGVLRIMDFGIARAVDTQTLTGSSEMMGTPDYISPEQVKGDTATAQSDLYAIGVILYELLTGEVPFKGDTAISKVVARLQVKPVLPRSLNPEIPSYLERIVLKLMEVDADFRYKTAQEVLQDLEREQVDSSFFLRTRKSIVRRRGQIAAACLVGAAVLGVWYYRALPEGAASADVNVTTLAILPFHNMTGNPELQWMENGIPEMLITDISQSRSLRPLLEDRIRRILNDLGKAGQTSFDEQTLEVFSNMAGADYILHGRFLESEGRLRIDLTLRERATGVGTPMKLDGKAAEVFDLVDSITERLSTQLDLDSFFERNRPIAEVATASLDAFRAYQRGIGDLQDGRNRSAISSLERAVTTDPHFTMAHAKLAEAHSNLGESDQAKQSIEVATTLAAESSLPISERLQIHAIAASINEDPDTALDTYRKLAEYYPTDPDISLGLARALERKGDIDGALKEYQAVIASSPGYGAALLGLGRMLVTADRFRDAIPVLEKAVSSGEFQNDLESLGMLHSVLGVAYRGTQEYGKALEHFQISLEARRKVNDKRGVITALIHLAIANRKVGRFEEASVSLEEAVRSARDAQLPSSESFALQNLGNLAIETGRLDDALSHYRASLEIEWDLNRDNEIAYRLDAIAEVYRLKGRYVDALVYLNEASTRLSGVDQSSELAFNQSVLGQILRARGAYDQAAEALLKAIPVLEQSDQIRDLASARRALTDIYLDQGRFVEALQIVEQGLTFFQNDPGGLAATKVHYAKLLLELGDADGAEEQLESILSIIPTLEFDARPEFHYVRGRVLAEKGNEAALRHLALAADEGANGGDVLFAGQASIALGRLLVSKGQLGRGRIILEKSLEDAVELRHRSVQSAALIELANCELAQGNSSRAFDLLVEARNVAAPYTGRLILTRANYELSLVAEMLGDETNARKAGTEARSLIQWMAERTPNRYVESLQKRWPLSVGSDDNGRQ